MKPPRQRASTVARAREPPEERIRHCMALMREGEWRKGETGLELAAEWGMSRFTLDKLAAEAWRRVQAEVLDAPAIQVFAVEKLKEIVRLQMAEASASDKPGLERRVAGQALDTLLKYADSGVLFPAGWDNLGADEKWAAVDRAQAKIDAVRATLPARESPQLGEGEPE